MHSTLSPPPPKSPRVLDEFRSVYVTRGRLRHDGRRPQPLSCLKATGPGSSGTHTRLSSISAPGQRSLASRYNRTPKAGDAGAPCPNCEPFLTRAPRLSLPRELRGSRPTRLKAQTQRGGPAMSSQDRASTRREFLGRGLRFTIAVGITPACLSGVRPAEGAGPLVKFSHGTGLCNMPLFYAGEKKLFAKYGANAEVVLTVPGTATIQLASNQVEMAVLPYTSAIAAYTRSPGFSVVSGSGIQGLQVVAKPGIKGFADLKGKKVGAQQADTLDIMLYDYMTKHGMTYKDVQMQYIADTFELSNAFIAGQLDAIAIIEPYATKCKTATGGSFLGDGVDMYGQGYPDCVLLAQKKVIDKEPEVVKNVIRACFDADYEIETNLEEAGKLMVGKYYKTDMASLLSAAKAQPPGVDIRDKRDFMFGRAQSMRELNYISKDPDRDFVNFKYLEVVIQESPELWKRVKVHSRT